MPGEYLKLMRLDRPIGIYLLLWPTLWALWIAADGHPDPWRVAVFVAGVVLMRAAGCVVNDYADRAIDPHVTRTRDRPLAAGRVSPRAALVLFVLLCIAALMLVSTQNALTVALAVPAALLAASYPYTKRFFPMPQAYLGLAFAWSVPMAFAAETGRVPPLAGLLMLAVVLWTVAYDTLYAMVDRVDDVKLGVHSSAILFGRADRPAVALLHAAALLLLAYVGARAGRGMWFYAGLGVAAGLAVYQQVLIRHREPARCFTAFLNNHPFGAAICAGLIADYWAN